MERPSKADGYFEMLREWSERGIPFNRVLGVRVRSIEHGRARVAVPYRDELIGDVLRPALHGGVISSLVDVAGGIAVLTSIEPGDRVSTIDLRVDYLRPGPQKAIVADARVIRSGNRVGVVDVRVHVEGGEGEGDGEPIALGKGVYSIKRGAK